MARKKKPSLSTAFAFMSDEAQSTIEAQAQGPLTLPIASIRPDPNQPRRLLPQDLAERVAKGSLAPVEAMQAWLERAEGATADAAVPRNLHELKRLAASISQHGLINPISVREPAPTETVLAETRYLIVTGERRYWAYVYLLNEGLQIHEGDTTTDAAKIKATLAPPGVTVRAHQFIENLLREDINAIERARGMWALRYELSGMRHGFPPAGDETEAMVNHGSPLNEAEAMVNHGSPDPSPRQLVPWARVEEVLGISKRYRIFTVSVLNLSSEAQILIEKHALAERTIRPIVQKLKDKPALQLKALQQLVTWQEESEDDDGPGRSIVTAVKDLVEMLLVEELRAAEATSFQAMRSVSSAPVIRFRNKVRQTLDFLGRLKSQDRVDLTTALGRGEFADVMIDLRNLRNQLDEILERASGREAVDPEGPPESAEKSD